MRKVLISITAAASILTLSACNSSGSNSEVIVETSAGNISQEEFYNELKDQFGEFTLSEMIYEQVLSEKYTVTDEETANEVITKLNNGTAFAELAKEYSVDTTTAEAGGELGYFSTGEMTLPFENAAFNLEIGELSEPVETEFGYHIIKVTNKQQKKNPDLAPFEDMKEQINDTLLNQKADLNALLEIIDNANIDIKDADLKNNLPF